MIIFLKGLYITLTIFLSLTKAWPSEESIQKAKDILDKYPVIDGHNDLAMILRYLYQNNLQDFNFNSDLNTNPLWTNMSFNRIDLPRMKEGRQGGQFWSAYISCRSQYKDATQVALEQIDVIKRLIEMNSNEMAFVTDAQGIEEAFETKKIASLIGLESGHGLDSDLSILRMFYELGVRYVTLTHNCNNPWADSAPSEDGTEPIRNEGLSRFGTEMVLEMNRLGMLVDISHVSQNTMQDVLDTSVAPIIFSHSGVRALCSTPKNVPDQILAQLPQNGGLIMLNFYNWFLNCDRPNCIGFEDCPATAYDVVEHIEHARHLAGVDHVGIGSDFCGIELTPDGAEDVSKFPVVFAILLEDYGWTEEELGKLASNNLIRVLKQVESISEDLQSLQPHQDWIPDSDFEPNEVSCKSEF